MRRFARSLSFSLFLRLLGLLALPVPAGLFLNDAFGQNQDPRGMSDRTWIMVSGTAESADDEAFELNYGEGTLTVEMNGQEWYEEAFGKFDGEEVTVYAYVDDDLFNAETIKAVSLYLRERDIFYAPGGIDRGASGAALVPSAETMVHGTVMEIVEDGYTVDTGLHTLTVSTVQLGYDPFDDEGNLQIEAGDRVAAVGNLDSDFFRNRVFDATRLSSLKADSAPPTW